MPVVSDFGFTMRPSRRDLVLVVADDPKVGGDLVARLQEDGYSVLSATNADEASAMLPTMRASVLIVATTDVAALRLAQPIPIVVVAGDGAALASQLNAPRFTTAANVEQITDAVASVLTPS
jgi:CheY-like chemotaxis protein